MRWWPSVFPAAVFAVTACVLFYLATRPAIEIHSHWLRIGNEMIPWQDIRRVDSTRFRAPLGVYLTLFDDRRIRLLYPGRTEASANLLRYLRRNAREALIDGVPYRQFWGEPAPSATPPRGNDGRRTTITTASGSAAAMTAPPKYRIVRPEEEEEIERMLQRLRTVGHLDSKNSDEN